MGAQECVNVLEEDFVLALLRRPFALRKITKRIVKIRPISLIVSGSAEVVESRSNAILIIVDSSAQLAWVVHCHPLISATVLCKS